VETVFTLATIPLVGNAQGQLNTIDEWIINSLKIIY
jgi:hypothetical protein